MGSLSSCSILLFRAFHAQPPWLASTSFFSIIYVIFTIPLVFLVFLFLGVYVSFPALSPLGDSMSEESTWVLSDQLASSHCLTGFLVFTGYVRAASTKG